MPLRYALVILLLVLLPTLNGCGGSSEGPAATPTAPTSISIKVSPTTAITTDESGLTAAISVSLGSQPTADVTIPVNSSDTTEGTVDKDSLVFTKETWSTVQTITVTGVDDPSNDGNQSYTIHLGPADSTDSSYRGLEKFVSATNLDVRKGAFVVSPISGNTSESGTTATFDVCLGSAPAADVTLPIQSSLLTEGTVDKDKLIFTTSDWDQYQRVTVTGVDDGIADADQEYTIQLGPAVSADRTYNNVDPDDLHLTNLALQPGFVDVINISGNSTDESGAQVTFQVKLSSQPTAEVTIPVSSSDDTEGLVSTAGMTSPAHNLTLTFTPDPSGTAGSWNDPQTVTVSGVDDPEADGTVEYSIKLGPTSSDDDNYNGLDPVDVSLSNLNVKTGSFETTAISGATNESGQTASFEVRLKSAPAYDVTVPIRSDDLSEGTVSPSSLTFTKTNYSFQTVTVTGVADNLADGNVPYKILLGPSTSTDDDYSGLVPADVTVTNLDVRSAGFVVTSISGPTNEAGGKATFTVKLASQPTKDVTIGVWSDDESEGTASPSQLVFSNTSWDTPQTVTVTGVSDTTFDNTIYNIVLDAAVSEDGLYSGQNPPDVELFNEDRQRGLVTVSAISGNTDESGQTATFTVSLNYAPAADVTIAISSSNPSEGTVSTPLTLKPTNWNMVPVTVTGADDAIADGNQAYSISLGATSSNDYNFQGLTPAPATVTVTNVDLVDPYGVTPRISAGNVHSLLLASDGTVWGWGACKNRELDPATASCPGSDTFILPQRLNISRASAISAGSSFSAIVKDEDGNATTTLDRRVWTSGYDEFGRLGRSGGASLAPVNDPLDPTGYLTNVTTVATGTYHVLALKNDGKVWAWGLGGSGQLGNGVYANSQTPVQATGGLSGKTVTDIAAGETHSLALDSTKTVYSWGADTYEQLGNGAGVLNTATPTAISSLSNVSAIGAGKTSSFAVGTHSTLGLDAYGWGQNTDYFLGTVGPGTTADLKNVPTGLNTFTSIILPTRIRAGTLHGLALSNEVPPKVYSWGDNDGGEDPLESQENFGALGITSSPPLDKTVPTATNFPSGTAPVLGSVDIAVGTKFSLVLLNDGRIQSAGNAQNDVLGTNEALSSITENSKIYRYTATPTYVEDPADPGTGTTPYYFYAYRPILSGQPATETTSTSARITVCGSPQTVNCGPITSYKYSYQTATWPGIHLWSDARSIATPIELWNLPPGTVDLWVKGMTSLTNEIQTTVSAVKISWEVVAP